MRAALLVRVARIVCVIFIYCARKASRSSARKFWM